MRVLAFDCATAACSAAVWEDGKVRAHESLDLAQNATQALVPMIARVMAHAQCGFANIERLGVAVGPGHFTGLRASLAVARGLQLARGLPVVGVTTLEAVAAATEKSARAGRRLIVALDSKRSEPYFQIFDADLTPLDSPVVMSINDFIAPLGREPLLLGGDAAPALAASLAHCGHVAEISKSAQRPDAAVIAEIAAIRALVAGPVQPLYLHPPAAKPLAGIEPRA